MIAPRFTIRAADLFCGAGGSSTGALAACRDLGYTLDLTAVNHWPVAVETHTANHGTATHFCEDLGSIDPLKAVPDGHLHLLVASPECTHHSNARGGKPMQDQSRASAWHVLRWAAALTVDNILIENVPEFRHWGGLGENGRPLWKLPRPLREQITQDEPGLFDARPPTTFNGATQGLSANGAGAVVASI